MIVARLHVGGKLLLISLIMDITDRTRGEREVPALQKRLRDQSTRDGLTGLYCRYGGEEFILVLPTMPPESADGALYAAKAAGRDRVNIGAGTLKA